MAPTALIPLTVVVPFLVALGVSLALVPVCRLVAHRFGVVAKPKEDRWHRRPVPLFGGVAIGLTLFGGAIGFGGLNQLSVILACTAVIFIVGLIDDVVTLRASTKLVVQIALASVLLFFRYRLNWIPSLTLDMLLTLVWIVGMTNAFNLLDNMDGLCGGISLIVGVALLVGLLPAEAGSAAFVQVQYLAVLLGATAGFLVYNVHPASIFMGDSGSLLLGFSFAALTLGQGQYIAGRSDPASIIAGPLLVLLIPIFDTTLVTVSRILSGRSAAEGGKDHSSHRLVAIGLSERAAVAVLWLLAAAGAAIGVTLNHFNISWSALVAVVFVLAMAIFAVYLAKVRVYEDEDAIALSEGKFTPLVVDFVYRRRAAEVVLDLCLVTIAYYSAYRLRFEGNDFVQNFSSFYRSLPIVLATQMIAFFAFGVYRGVWRYFGLTDTLVIAKAALAGTVGSQVVILYLFRFDSYSRTVFAIYGVLLVLVVIASRASFRLIGEALHRRRKAGQRMIIYGAGDGGSLVIRELLNSKPTVYKILGFVDDDPRMLKARVQGYPVLGGYDCLVSLITNGVVDSVMVSATIMDVERLGELEALCSDHGVSLARLHVGFEPIVGSPKTPTAAPEGQFGKRIGGART